MSLMQQIDYISPAINENTHICDDYHQIACRMINLNHGVFSVITPLRVIRTICKAAGIKGYSRGIYHKIELLNVEVELVNSLREIVESNFDDYMEFDGYLYFKSNQERKE